MEHEIDGNTNSDWCTLKQSPKDLKRDSKNFEMRGQVGTKQNYCIIKIGRNTEKSPGNLSRLLSFKLK